MILFLQNNFKAIIVYPLHNSFLPTNVDDYSGVIIFGGVMNVSDTKEYPGLLKELNWIESLLNSNIPVIGICLGAQLIAKAAGAIVSPHKDNLFEIGYKKIFLNSSNIFFKNFPKKVFHWHGQGCTLPEGASLIASNSTFNIQAFVIKEKIFGFQFHPEINKKILLNWNDHSKHMLSFPGAVDKEIQLKDHAKYSNSVKYWFENFMKNWIELY